LSFTPQTKKPKEQETLSRLLEGFSVYWQDKDGPILEDFFNRLKLLKFEIRGQEFN